MGDRLGTLGAVGFNIFSKVSHFCFCARLGQYCQYFGGQIHLERFSDVSLLQVLSVTPPIIDFDYDGLKEAVRWRHPHAWNRLEVQ